MGGHELTIGGSAAEIAEGDHPAEHDADDGEHEGDAGDRVEERAVGAGAKGQLGEGDQGRSLQGARENNKERSKQ